MVSPAASASRMSFSIRLIANPPSKSRFTPALSTTPGIGYQVRKVQLSPEDTFTIS